MWPDEKTLRCLKQAVQGAVPTGVPRLVFAHGYLAVGWRGQGEQRRARRVRPGFAHASRWPACAGQPRGRRNISDLKQG